MALGMDNRGDSRTQEQVRECTKRGPLALGELASSTTRYKLE